MTQKQKAHTIASIGTALFLLLLFLLLWFVYIGAPVQEEDEGIEIAFGDNVSMQSAASAALPAPTVAQPVPPTPVPPAPSAPATNDLMTQENEESLAMARQREEQEKKRREAELEAQRLREEQERIRQEQEAERRRQEQLAAEKKAREDAAKAKAAQMGNLFGQSNASGNGSTNQQSGGAKGNPVGKGSGEVGGNKWSLSGRDAKSLPQPSNNFQQEGTVVVEIWVDDSGNVIDAKAIGGSVSDATTRSLAVQAARKAKFSSVSNGTGKARGTITYTFRFI